MLQDHIHLVSMFCGVLMSATQPKITVMEWCMGPESVYRRLKRFVIGRFSAS